MGTAYVSLPIPGGTPPDGSGTGNNPATPELIVSNGTQTTNTPRLTYVQLLFDQTTDENWMWSFRLPSDYASGGTVKISWGAKVTSGNVVWKAGVEAIDPSSIDADAAVFNAADTASAVAVPSTAGHEKDTSISLTTTGLTANDRIVVFVGRDADNGSDDAAGDAFITAVEFSFTV